ncbi:hypothetical protein PIB30_038907 [Stylosanthes scabra]|uniref:RING-type E3 ubiquitin transferase n=1 Tax=Stylosanthes scabra TaxID=79078 RepID=A0ABU6QEP4_9FABA|nr:hypothetical protein [Stylosanthes scabra]
MQLHRRALETDLTTIRPSPSSSSPSSSSILYETNFDANIVIILAALLCALVGALGLNSIARCALRCGRRMTEEQEAARLATTGLKKSHLRRIPVAVYGSGENIPGTECPICLGEFEKGDKVRMLPECKHGFDVRCIDTWLVSHSSCPNCRHSLLQKKPKLDNGASSSSGGGGDGGKEDGRNVVVVQDRTS